MHEAVQRAVDVAEAVREVDPRVDHEEGDEELDGGREDVDGELGEGEFQGSEILGLGVGRRESTAADDAGKGCAGAFGCLAQLFGVDAYGV